METLNLTLVLILLTMFAVLGSYRRWNFLHNGHEHGPDKVGPELDSNSPRDTQARQG